MTKEKRDVWADSAINHYSEDKEGGLWGDLYDDDDIVLTDLLTDLMHWADARLIDFHAAFQTAEMHHKKEAAP